MSVSRITVEAIKRTLRKQNSLFYTQEKEDAEE